MKPTRVILTSNLNPIYYHFWNPISKVYKEKFGIIPTLIWLGTKKEAKEAGISSEYGEIKYVKPHPDYHLPWQTTWVSFWSTQFYPNDVCIMMGIDQVPLSRMFFDMAKDVSDEDYAMLIADAYKPNYWTTTASPSAYHIAKGSTFMKVFNFEKNFKKEAEKVYNSGIMGFHETTEGRWGIDENYSCAKLREGKVNVVAFDNFSKLVQHRIECERHKEPPYDLNRLNEGLYSEGHLCRPFTNHTEYLTKLFNDIPSWL